MAMNNDDIKNIMQRKRFYHLHSSSGDGRFWRYVKTIELFGIKITIHAEVDVENNHIELNVVGLKFLMQITTGRFAFDHKDFEDYEATIVHYAYHCLSNPPIFG